MTTIHKSNSEGDIVWKGIKQSKMLTCPSHMLEQIKCSPDIEQFIFNKRREISNIIHGKDDRLLVIIGPCSIHNINEAMEYAKRLSIAAKKYESTLLIVMRVYLEKPRSTVGWKGLIYDPHLDGTNDIEHGLKTARQLLLDINSLQLPCSCEFLHPLVSHYISDLISWAAIGARTTESQIHRELVSGLGMPIGLKNGTTGCIRVAIDACIASRKGHTSLSVNENGNIVCYDTAGNEDVHVVLRGGTTTGPNYSPKHISNTRNLLEKSLVHTKIMVDCSHGNSLKNCELQNEVISDVGQQIGQGEEAIMGVMIESNIVGGSQTFVEGNKHLLEYGKSITDACISWDETETQLKQLSDSVLQRRSIIKCSNMINTN